MVGWVHCASYDPRVEGDWKRGEKGVSVGTSEDG